MNDIDEEFLQMESKLGLFDESVDNDIYVWERIRRKVRNRLAKHLEDRQQAHTVHDSTTDDLRKTWQLVNNVFRRNTLLSDNKTILFYGHSRRKQMEDGLWWDIYTDPIIEQINQDYLLVESPYLASHKTPAKTQNIRYLDMITYADGVRNKLQLYNNLDWEDREFFDKIEIELENRFGVTINVTELGKREILSRNTRLPLYRKALKRIDPEVVVLVVSYGKETFIEACQEKRIPVIELQHGVIHRGHFGYHYPGDRQKRHFPDYLLTFGKYWDDCVEYPIIEGITASGYPYLEQRREKYADVSSKDQILFISQGTIGEQLSKFAVEVNEHQGIDHEIIYKLHPGEYDRWQREYPWLIDTNINVIDGSEPPLYHLFAESSVQIGVYSTAIYEGLCFNLETYLYDCFNVENLDPLIDKGTAKRISSVNELHSLLGQSSILFDREHFFMSNATKNVCDIIRTFSPSK